ncbi:hypothetical protein Q5752_006890 [Cryptotrichosporon argae]
MASHEQTSVPTSNDHPSLSSATAASTSVAASPPLAPALPTDLTATSMPPTTDAPATADASSATAATPAPAAAASTSAAPPTTPAPSSASAPPAAPSTSAPAAAPVKSAAGPTRRLSKRDRSAAQTASSNTAGTASTMGVSKAPSKPAAGAGAGASASASTSGAPAQPRRKKKKGLFASLFAALGCASDVAVDDGAGRKRDLRSGGEKERAKDAKAAAPAADRTDEVKEEPKVEDTRHQAETTGTTLVGVPVEKDKDAEAKGEDVVVAPHEPKTLPLDETAGVTSSAVQPPGSGSELLLAAAAAPHLARRDSEQHVGAADNQRTDTSGGYTDLSDSDEDHHDFVNDEEYEDEEDRLIAQGGIGIPVDEHGNPVPLLPAIDKRDTGRMCLVLDLDETLLHSSFKALQQADYIVPVEIESQLHNVYVIKRPGVDHFLEEMGKIYEIVVFTASLSKYADPVLDMLDKKRVVRHRLFRESCYNHKGNYVKDLSQLGRPIEHSIIIDNSPASYIFHPNNAVPISTWFNDPHDTELTDLCPFLTELATVGDVRGVLDGTI